MDGPVTSRTKEHATNSLRIGVVGALDTAGSLAFVLSGWFRFLLFGFYIGSDLFHHGYQSFEIHHNYPSCDSETDGTQLTKSVGSIQLFNPNPIIPLLPPGVTILVTIDGVLIGNQIYWIHVACNYK
jgi:hypothetical protein